jgi:hypothetical protein
MREFPPLVAEFPDLSSRGNLNAMGSYRKCITCDDGRIKSTVNAYQLLQVVIITVIQVNKFTIVQLF